MLLEKMNSYKNITFFIIKDKESETVRFAISCNSTHKWEIENIIKHIYEWILLCQIFDEDEKHIFIQKICWDKKVYIQDSHNLSPNWNHFYPLNHHIDISSEI